MSAFTKNLLASFLLTTSLILTTSASATTSGSKYITDPIDGSKCRVSVVMSYGSYIYRAPSKYDQVFFPQTSNTGIWHCPESGFTSLIEDAEITAEEKEAITLYLDKNYKGLDYKNRPDRLDLLEEIYKIRNTTSRFDNKLLRILANHYNTEKGNEYRKLAYEHTLGELLSKGIKDLTLKQMTEYFYLVAHYSKTFGTEEEKEGYSDLFDTVVVDKVKNKDIATYALYLRELLNE